MIKRTTAWFLGAFILILLLIGGAIVGSKLNYFSSSLSNSLVLAAGPLATLVLAYSTLASIEHSRKNFEELRRDRKEDDIKRLIAIAIDPVLESLLAHRSGWEKEPLHSDKPILPSLHVTKIPEDVSLSDLDREADHDSLRSSILDYFDSVSEYNELRAEIDNKIQNRLDDVIISPGTIPKVSLSIKEQQEITDRKPQMSNEILNNTKKNLGDVSISRLVYIRELDEFSGELDELSSKSESIKSQNHKLLCGVKEIRDDLMDEYDLNDSEILEYRKRDPDLPNLFRVRREYSTVKPHLGR